jgi:Tfp pilus assembly protein PilF
MSYRCAIAAIVGITACRTQQTPNGPATEAAVQILRYLEQGMCEHALERGKLALEYDPEDAALHNVFGIVLLQCTPHDPEPAIARFKRAIAIDSDLTTAHNNLGTALLQRTKPDYELACEEFGEALAIDPGYLDARENLGMCLARRAKLATPDEEERAELYAEARSQMMRLIEIDATRANAFMWLGFVSTQQGHTARAIEELERCVELSPEHGTCQLYLGDAQLLLAQCTPAIIAFSRAAADEAVAPDARRGLASAHELCAKKDGAIKTLLDALAKTPGDPETHVELARIYRERGLLTEAEKEWRNVITLDAKRCAAHFELAMIADERFDTAETINFCREFVLCARLSNSEDERVERCTERLVTLARE